MNCEMIRAMVNTSPPTFWRSQWKDTLTNQQIEIFYG